MVSSWEGGQDSELGGGGDGEDEAHGGGGGGAPAAISALPPCASPRC